MTKRNRFIAAVCLITAFLAAVPFAVNEKPKEIRYEIPAESIATPIKLAFLSDVHSSFYGRDMEEIAAPVEEFEPDAVIFGGDLFDEQWGEENAMVLVKRLAAQFPCYYALGNHEFRVNPQRIKDNISALGVTVLDGKYADITKDGGKLRLIGIDGATHSDQLYEATVAVSDDAFNILLDHYPEEFPLLLGKGFDLILSGHAHGGQIRIPFILNGLFAPGQGLFPKYAGGEYEREDTRMIVSRGLARLSRDLVIPRVFNRPETVFITIGGQSL